MIKRVTDAFDLKDESIDLNALKGDLAGRSKNYQF